MKYISAILILSISFLSCNKNDSEIQKLRGYPKVPEQMYKKIPERTHQLIKSKSLHLIDSVLVKYSIIEEVGFGYTYSISNEKLKYLNTYRIDTTHNKIIKIEFDLDLNVVDWDTVIYVP